MGIKLPLARLSGATAHHQHVTSCASRSRGQPSPPPDLHVIGATWERSPPPSHTRGPGHTWQLMDRAAGPGQPHKPVQNFGISHVHTLPCSDSSDTKWSRPAFEQLRKVWPLTDRGKTCLMPPGLSLPRHPFLFPPSHDAPNVETQLPTRSPLRRPSSKKPSPSPPLQQGLKVWCLELSPPSTSPGT